MEILNSKNLASLVHFPLSSEPITEAMELGSESGILVGNSMHFNMPIFADPIRLLNPHILICGMTGGGKTYLAKSLLVRMHLFSEARAVVIDFTGEYRDVLSNLTDLMAPDISMVFNGTSSIAYLDLHMLPEPEKVARASKALDIIAELTRSRSEGDGSLIFVMLDEAWKLVQNNKGLEVIIREGRKYRVGLITSSQLLGDTTPTILSNIASAFIFKTTDRKSLELLSKSYNIIEAELISIQNLDLGSCFMIQLHKSGLRSAFIVRKVAGLRDTSLIKLNKGENMNISISATEFEEMVTSLCGYQKSLQIRASIKDSVSLSELVARLMDSDADRRAILMKLEKIGFSHVDIADAFSVALGRMVDQDGK